MAREKFSTLTEQMFYILLCLREECCGRRELLRTSTRWAERQRMIEAEASRIAILTRQRRAMGSVIGKHCSSSSCSLAMKAFLLGFQRGHSLLRKRMAPLTRSHTVWG